MRPVLLLIVGAILAAGEVRITPVCAGGVVDRLVADAAGIATLASLHDDRQRCYVHLWDASNGRLLWARGARKDGYGSDAQLGLGSEALFAASKGLVDVLARVDGRLLAERTLPGQPLAMRPDGSLILVRSPQGLRGIDTRTWAEQAIPLPAEPLWARAAPDGTLWVGWERGIKRQFARLAGEAGALRPEAALTIAEHHLNEFVPVPWPTADGWCFAAITSGPDYVTMAQRWQGSAATGVPVPPGTISFHYLRTVTLPGGTLVFGDSGLVHTAAGIAEPPEWMLGCSAGAPSGPRAAVWRSGSLEIRDPDNGALHAAGEIRPAAIAMGFARSSDGRWLAVDTDGDMQIWDLALMRLDTRVDGGRQFGVEATPHPDLLFWRDSFGDGIQMVVWSLSGRRALPWLRRQSHYGRRLAWSRDGHLLVQPGGKGATIHRLPGGEVVAEIDAPQISFYSMKTGSLTIPVFSPDGHRVALLQHGKGGDEEREGRSVVVVVDVETGAVVARSELCGAEAGVDLAVAGDGWALKLDDKRALDIGPRLEGRREVAWSAPAPPPPAATGTTWFARNTVALDRDGGVAMRGPDGTAHLLASGEAWAVWDDAGRFDGSRDAERVIGAWRDGRRVGLDEVAATSNRPDLIMRALGCDDSPLLEAMVRASARRPAPGGGGPSATISGRTDGIHLDLRAGDAELAAVSVLVAGVPWSQVPAVSGRQAGFDIPLALPAGLHQIEAAVRDAAGRWSPRVRTDLRGTAPLSPRLHAACIGVSRYRDPSLELRYAAKDALDVALALSECPLGPEPAAVRAWTDAQVDAAAFAAARAHLAAADADDVAVLFLAGHGLQLREPRPQYRFLPHGADLADLEASTIPWEVVAGVFADCRALQRMIILDTCESGAAEDEAGSGVAGLRASGARGLRSFAVAPAASGLAAEYARSDRSRFLTAAFGASAGAVVLSSSRGGEPSFESEPDANGLFTQVLLSALRGAADGDDDGRIASDELVRYLAGEVGRRSGGRQRPTIDRDNPQVRIGLPVVPPLE